MKRSQTTTYLGIMFLINPCYRVVSNLTYDNPELRILFLHHSTGYNVWLGDIDNDRRYIFKKSVCMAPRLMKEYNEKRGLKISLEEQNFPKGRFYPWQNNPYDYYNIWVENGRNKPFREEPTLEILTKDFDIIIFKHCFPVSNILDDDKNPEINSQKMTLSNYKLQYNALKEKIYEFPQTRFIVWTGAALIESKTNEKEAIRAKEFADWVKNEWDNADDNIHVFDFRELETGGGLYLKPEFAVDTLDSHPNKTLSIIACRSLINRIIDVIENR